MTKLDLKTKLFLYLTKANIVSLNLEQKIDIPNVRKNEVYVFDNYEEYVKYYQKYLKNIDKNLIKKAIYTTGKQGQIIAFKGLCERIIIKQRTQEFYDALTQTKIDEIHKKGKLTPYDKVEEYEKKIYVLQENL